MARKCHEWKQLLKSEATKIQPNVDFFQLTLNRFYVYDRNTNLEDFFGGDSSFSLFHSLVALTMLKHS